MNAGEKVKKIKNSIPKSWLSSTTIFSVISIFFSLVAITISMKSCSISERALNLTRQDFDASRTVVYKSTLNASNDELFLTSVDQNIQLQCAAIYYPPQLDSTVWNISPPDFGLSLVVLRNEIGFFLDENVIREMGYYKVIDQTSIPIIIGSSYVAKGQAYQDVSLYQFVYIAVVSDNKFEPPSVTFKGLIFRERLSVNTNPQNFLSELWNAAELSSNNGGS